VPDRRPEETRRLTHYLHSTPEAGRQMGAVPWPRALLALVAALVVAVGLIYWLA
jgi:hypothetical protein